MISVLTLMQQQGEHLNGLAESHVIGQTGAKTQLGEQVQPGQSLTLIRPQRALQGLGHGVAVHFGRYQRPGVAQLREDVAQGCACLDVDPGSLGLGLLLVFQIGRGPRQQTHALDEGNLAVLGLLSDVLPVGNGLLKPVAIDLHPLSLEQDERLVAIQEGVDFIGSQRFATQGHFNVEIEQRLKANPGWRPGADGHRHLRASPLAPPIGKTHR